jgi:hypothetical protein
LSIVEIQPVPEYDNIRSPVSGRRLHMPAEILSDSDQPSQIGRDPAILIGSGQTFSPESGNDDQTLPDSSGICQTLIFGFCNFFVRAKHRKIFSKKLFFLKIISSKLFYDENHFTSKQAEH